MNIIRSRHRHYRILPFACYSVRPPQSRLHCPPERSRREMAFRKESDTMGEMQIPVGRYYGAQTARALVFFRIGGIEERMPLAIIRAFGILKKASAEVNRQFGLDAELSDIMSRVSDEIIDGRFDDDFPLLVWQTGSGTQSNMNVNEVIANRANELLGSELGSKKPVHPNDHCNMSQSSNDTFPAAMHIAVVCQLHEHLFPSIEKLCESFIQKAQQLDGVHLNADGRKVNVAQLFNECAQLLRSELQCIADTMPHLLVLAIGGTAVGTGLNAPLGFAEKVADRIAELTGFPFITAPNKFAVLAASDAMVEFHGTLNTLATALMRIAIEVHRMAEMTIISAPNMYVENQAQTVRKPAELIMNEEFCEIVAMIAAQVMGNQTAVTVAASNGHFELNTFKPVIISNVLHSLRLLADTCNAFAEYCIDSVHLSSNCPIIVHNSLPCPL